MNVAHFKWTAGVAEKLLSREELFKKQGIHWWMQSARARVYLNSHFGQLPVQSKVLDCRLAGSVVNATPAQKALKPPREPKASRGRATVEHAEITVLLYTRGGQQYQPGTNLESLALYYAGLNRVYEVVLIWNGADAPPIAPTAPGLAPIRLVTLPAGVASYRWSDRIDVKTVAVVATDDSVILPAHTIRSIVARYRVAAHVSSKKAVATYA